MTITGNDPHVFAGVDLRPDFAQKPLRLFLTRGKTAARRMDSGSARKSTTASSSGSAPPRTNSTRQPSVFTNCAAAMPLAIEPIESDQPVLSKS
jgi:hypothetical protein